MESPSFMPFFLVYLIESKVSSVALIHVCIHIIMNTGSMGSIVVCISPLTALMMDQRSKFAQYGLSTEFVGEAQTDKTVRRRVEKYSLSILLPRTW